MFPDVDLHYLDNSCSYLFLLSFIAVMRINFCDIVYAVLTLQRLKTPTDLIFFFKPNFAM